MSIKPFSFDDMGRLDYFATKTGAIIVPSCGMDSIPSDLSAYLANKTLKAELNDDPRNYATTSTTAYNVKTGISGGTFASAIYAIEETDMKKLKYARQSYSLSPGMSRLILDRFQSDRMDTKLLGPRYPSSSLTMSLLSQESNLLSVAIL